MQYVLQQRREKNEGIRLSLYLIYSTEGRARLLCNRVKKRWSFFFPFHPMKGDVKEEFEVDIVNWDSCAEENEKDSVCRSPVRIVVEKMPRVLGYLHIAHISTCTDHSTRHCTWRRKLGHDFGIWFRNSIIPCAIPNPFFYVNILQYS